MLRRGVRLRWSPSHVNISVRNCSSVLSAAVWHITNSSLGEGRVYFSLQLTVCHRGTIMAGARAGQEGSSLACPSSYSSYQLAFLHSPGAAGLGPPTSFNNQESAPTDLPVGQSNGGNSSVEVPSSQLCQVDSQVCLWH